MSLIISQSMHCACVALFLYSFLLAFPPSLLCKWQPHTRAHTEAELVCRLPLHLSSPFCSPTGRNFSRRAWTKLRELTSRATRASSRNLCSLRIKSRFCASTSCWSSPCNVTYTALQKCHCDATERGEGEKNWFTDRVPTTMGKRDQCRHWRRLAWFRP